MPKCALRNCQSNTLTTQKKHGVTYHRFPTHVIRREIWRKLVAKERFQEFYKPNKSSVICSDHFGESDMYLTPKGLKRLKQTAVPHIEVRSAAIKIENSDNVEIDYRDTERPIINNGSIDISTLPSSAALDARCNAIITSHFKKKLTQCQIKLQFKDRQIRNLRKQNMRLVKANLSLKEIIQELKKNRLINDVPVCDSSKIEYNHGDIKIENNDYVEIEYNDGIKIENNDDNIEIENNDGRKIENNDDR